MTDAASSLRPICFMVMPFGTKPTGSGSSGAPAKVDFDAVWQKAFAPALEELGYDPVRADQDLGALIINEMLERLVLSDLVLADLTIPNGNVYYEVGIRHAARETGAALLGADWSRPLFDVDQMRRITYPLPEEKVSDATAAAIREKISQALPQLAKGNSPIWQALPGYPQVTAERTSSFRKLSVSLSLFRASSLAIQDGPTPEARRAKALKLRDDYSGNVAMRPYVSLEVLRALRDYTDWQTTLKYIDSLPEDIATLSFVREQRCLAQSGSGDHQEAIGALKELIRIAGETSERQGLLGGRYKRLFNQAQKGGDMTAAARFLDLAIEHYGRGMALDLNDYFPSCNLPRLLRRRGRPGDAERARIVQMISREACERSRLRDPNDQWARQTLLGFVFDDGDAAAAEQLLPDIQREGAAVWQLQSTLDDLKRSASLQPDPDTQQKLQKIIGELETLVSVDPAGGKQ